MEPEQLERQRPRSSHCCPQPNGVVEKAMCGADAVSGSLRGDWGAIQEQPWADLMGEGRVGVFATFTELNRDMCGREFPVLGGGLGLGGGALPLGLFRDRAHPNNPQPRRQSSCSSQ